VESHIGPAWRIGRILLTPLPAVGWWQSGDKKARHNFQPIWLRSEVCIILTFACREPELLSIFAIFPA
jgi:hypothetical protein